jgi:hypothetical protein
MSAEIEDKARALSMRLAQRMNAETPAGELAELRAGLSEALRRLDKLESRGATQSPIPNSPSLALHPSQERFGLEPAVTEMVDFLEGGKRCAFEPGNKPCDNCSMCTARGF